MNCMKCGCEMKESGVFCPNCLEEMGKYPVKPDIKVHIPYRPATVATRKKAKRHAHIKPEDQIRHLKKVRNWLVVLLVLLLVAFAASALLNLYLMGSDIGLDLGQFDILP